MANGRVMDLGHARFPKTYREKYWGAVGSALLVTLILWARTFGSDRYVIYAILALFLFMILNLVVTRIVLRDDRIESINLLGRRSLLMAHIDRLETREVKVKGKTVKTYLLMPKSDQDKPLMIPGTLAMDDAWFAWMEPIPEVAIKPSKSAEATTAATGAILCIVFGFVAVLALPIFKPQLKPYFDVLNLFLPWFVCLYVFTSDRFRGEGLSDFGGIEAARKAAGVTVIGMVLMLSPICLFVSGRGNGGFVIGADSLTLVCASVAMALASLALMHFSPIDTLNMKRDGIAYVVGFAGLYGYGAALTANELFDTSIPQTAPVVIESKFVQTGKGGGSFFKLAPWGPETMERSYRPSVDTYHQLRVSDSICAALHPGAIGMRWYQLSDSCP